jgi:hypothetical protein
MKTKKKSNILLTEGGVSGLGSCRVSGLVQQEKHCHVAIKLQFRVQEGTRFGTAHRQLSYLQGFCLERK